MPSGLKAEKLMREALVLDLHRLANGKRGKSKRLYYVASALVDLAMEGDLGAIREVYDRVDGRVPQEQRIAGADGGAVLLAVEDNRPRIDAAVLGLLLGATTNVDTAPADAQKTIEHDTQDASDAKP
jgi:hypothetical protein